MLGNIIVGNRLKRFHAKPKVDVNFIILENLYNEFLNKISVGLDSWRSDASRLRDLK